MTVKLSINVPDDAEARRARQQEASQSYGTYLRRRTPQQVEDERVLIEGGNDIALRDSQW